MNKTNNTKTIPRIRDYKTAVGEGIGYGIAIPLNMVPDMRFTGTCPHFLALFGFGMLAATLAHDPDPKWDKWREKRFWIPSAFVLGLIIVVGMVVLKERAFENGYWFDFLAGLGSMFLLIGVGRARQGLLHRLLSARPLVWIGGFSYSIYLIHAPLLQFIWQYLLRSFHSNDGLTLFLLVVPGMALIVGLSYFFYWGCERPFLNTKRTLIERKPQE